MKKAIVLKEDYEGHIKDQILIIGDASKVDSWSTHFDKRVVKLEIPEELKDLSQHLLKVVLVDETPGTTGVLEHWTNGTDTVYDANDIPTLTDEDGNPYLDTTYSHVDEVLEVAPVPAHQTITKTAEADQEIRSNKMRELDTKRQVLLKEADVKINILEDASQDASTYRSYRQQLRDVTEPFKDDSGDWNSSADILDVENYSFPAKPA